MDIRRALAKRVLLSDGAMGTMFQQAGVGLEFPAETLNFTHPELVLDIHRQYVQAGSDFICTNTFAATGSALARHGYTVRQAVEAGVRLARQAGAPAVALDVAPTGRMMRPIGDLEFEEAVALFRETVRAGLDSGIDLILFETFTDLYEMKAAVVAARELTDLPVFCSMSFETNGRLLTGADPLTVVNTLQDMGIDAIGVNCSTGPEEMLPIVRQFLEYAHLPVLVQPNAGLPVEEDGRTFYRTDSRTFRRHMETMIGEGVAVIGGCCGTTPEYIADLAALLKKDAGRRKKRPDYRFTAASSAVRTVVLDGRCRIIGERLNPTGKKALREALLEERYEYLEDEAVRQVDAGADILDVNVGVPGIDETAVMCEAVRRISAVADAPLQIDSARPEVLEAAARLYNGRPLLNSVNGKAESMAQVFPIVRKYGCNVVALTLDEKGVPRSVGERVEIAARIIGEAAKYGIGCERILVDCLTLTAATEPAAPNDTLKALYRLKRIYGVRTCLGVSNVSFGLPERKQLNRTFLTMALTAGLDAPIIDPTVPEYMEAVRSFAVLTGRDPGAQEYIAAFADRGASPSGAGAALKEPETASTSPDDELGRVIQAGLGDRAVPLTRALLKTHRPLEIVETIIIPALEVVGGEYERGNCFLPELVRAADTVQAAFTVLRGELEAVGENLRYGKILMATVRGDIHDIGKNIVAAILENYGYEIVDLGKDVPVESIVEAVREQAIPLVGLSALMTTTVASMAATIRALRDAQADCKVMVGGAVLDSDYAKRIDADFYCKDAMEAVRVAHSLFREAADR